MEYEDFLNYHKKCRSLNADAFISWWDGFPSGSLQYLDPVEIAFYKKEYERAKNLLYKENIDSDIRMENAMDSWEIMAEETNLNNIYENGGYSPFRSDRQ